MESITLIGFILTLVQTGFLIKNEIDKFNDKRDKNEDPDTDADQTDEDQEEDA